MSAVEVPPFRAEHIGSLLRPQSLLSQRARFARGEIDPGAMRQAEDAAILDAIRLQERLGFRFVTDGEFRRRSYHSYFYQQLGDLSIDAVPEKEAATGRGAQPKGSVRSRVTWSGPINVADYRFLAANSTRVPKITIPGPCALHFRAGDAAVLATAYTDMDRFWDDTIEAFARELAALHEAGCRYVQIDETAFAKFGDPDVQKQLVARGDDWSALIDTYIAVTNRLLKNAPADMQIGMHLCRGNRGGHWHAEGSYEEVADRLFNTLNIDFFFLEYDSPRAGDFSPLRYMPKTKTTVLGLVSTKSQAIEDKASLIDKIEQAVKYVPLERLSVSPQCGFASIDTGNPVTTEVEEAKLARVVEVAKEVWGTA
ncbi:MAG: 5-methyltetrahydropteroyltriglutamate--homocysteine S-methyltransferase [Pseudolabrys sp.]